MTKPEFLLIIETIGGVIQAIVDSSIRFYVAHVILNTWCSEPPNNTDEPPGIENTINEPQGAESNQTNDRN